MTAMDQQAWIAKLEAALNNIRPHLEADGGDVEIVKITEELDVHIRWIGNCETCDMSAMTLKAGIEQTIKSQFPEINQVVPLNGSTHEDTEA